MYKVSGPYLVDFTDENGDVDERWMYRVHEKGDPQAWVSHHKTRVEALWAADKANAAIDRADGRAYLRAVLAGEDPDDTKYDAWKDGGKR